MIQLAQRIMNAPDNDTRVQELVALTPDATLARIGLARRPSFLGTALTITGAVAVGAVLGAGTALLFAPTSGRELQTKLRRQAKRVSKDVKKATDQVEEAVAEVREQVASFTQGETTTSHNGHGKRHGAHA
jgi:gas vesicle protein